MGTDEVQADSLPIWTKNFLPQSGQFIMLVEEPNYDLGGTITAAYRIPADRIIANNAVQGNVYTLVDAEATITVPELTVVPAYVESFAPNRLKRAQASSPTTLAMFLIVGLNQNVDDGYLIQHGGYFVFPEAHAYTVGAKYYLSSSAAGGVTTVAPNDNVQPLFTVVDDRTIQVLIGA